MLSSSLTYIRKAPKTQNSLDKYPTIFFLHGRGADENDLFELSEYLDPRLQIFSLRAPYQYTFGGYTWFELSESFEANMTQVKKSCDALVMLLDEIQKNYAIDPEKIYLFGFSMGAILALTLGLIHPHRFKGVIAHSGLLLEDKLLNYKWSNLHKVSYFIAHGVFDAVIPVQFGKQAYQKLKQNNLEAIYREYPIAHSISEESITNVATWLKEKI